MADEKMSKIFFVAILLFLLILTFFIIKPFFSYMIIGAVLAGAFSPVYKWLLKKIKKENICASIMIIIILVLIIIPTFFVTTKLVSEAGKAYRAFSNQDFIERAQSFVSSNIGLNIDIQKIASDIFLTIRNSIVDVAPGIISSIAEVLLGLFVMFFVMFYIFKGGDSIYETIKDSIPLKKKYKDNLFSEVELVLKGVLYGQVLTAIIQGTIGGLLLFIFGVPNSLFWGFIMIILSFLPIIGTPIIFVPAGIFMIYQGNIFSGIMIIVLGFLIVTNIDNIIKPKLISSKSKIHPVIALIGVLGGLAVFGFVGLILGPIILALLNVLLKFYKEDFKQVFEG